MSDSAPLPTTMTPAFEKAVQAQADDLMAGLIWGLKAIPTPDPDISATFSYITNYSNFNTGTYSWPTPITYNWNLTPSAPITSILPPPKRHHGLLDFISHLLRRGTWKST